MAPDVDPFFDDVIMLLPFSGSGVSFTDYSPPGGSLVVANAGTAGNGVYTQDSARTLFGLPTLHMQKPASLAAQWKLFQNPSVNLTPSDDLCMEMMIYYDALAVAAASPQFWRFSQASGAGVYAGQSCMLSSSSAVQNIFNASLPLSSGTVPNNGVLQQWMYCCAQFVASESTLYMYFNQVPVSLNFQPPNTPLVWSLLNTFPGFQMNIGQAGSVRAFDMSMAQVRLTKANRYGLNAGNYLTDIPPAPTAPWPLTGP